MGQEVSALHGSELRNSQHRQLGGVKPRLGFFLLIVIVTSPTRDMELVIEWP